MARPVALIIAVAALAAGWSAAARAESCPTPRELKEIIVQVDSSAPATDYSHDLDQQAIARLAAQGLGSAGLGRPVGLTQAALRYSVSLEGYEMRRGASRCFWISKVKAKLSFDHMRVYIASDYPKDSCNYRVIRDHENEHVSLNLKLLPRFRQELERAIHQQVSRQSQYASREEAMDALKDAIQPTLASLEREQKRSNAAIDTEESYRRTNARCPRW